LHAETLRKACTADAAFEAEPAPAGDKCGCGERPLSSPVAVGVEVSSRWRFWPAAEKPEGERPEGVMSWIRGGGSVGFRRESFTSHIAIVRRGRRRVGAMFLMVHCRGEANLRTQ
jgi:hypothetical protein